MPAQNHDLRSILKPTEPLGPPFTEPLLRTSHEIFELLYDRSNDIHGIAERDDPVYVVGRKGSGKTAFLVGTAFVNRAEIILIKSEDAYHEVERLRQRYSRAIGPLFADNLSHVWKVLLTHAAMLLAYRIRRLRSTSEGRKISSYLSAYGNPDHLEAGQLLARVGGALSEALAETEVGLTFEESCTALRSDTGYYLDARDALTELLVRTGEQLYVMVDNLEDLHSHVDDLRVTLSALFRTTRDHANSLQAELPFRVRFAFPAELLRRLRDLTMNPEKDFLDYLTIRWTAGELITLAGNRLRRYLELYHRENLKRLGLPQQHDARDLHLAERTLRALLPEDDIRTGLGAVEDPVAYIMRHTQLLPRHLIQILNEVLRRSARRSDSLPRATPDDVLNGVKRAEHRIVEGVLASYSHDHPYLPDALAKLKNHMSSTLTCSELHRAFNMSGAAKSGLEYGTFLDAALEVGVLGVVEDATARYTVGRFSYTVAGGLRPVEGLDAVCVHPLFMYRLFDQGGIRRLADLGVKPVYPYGTDPAQADHDA